MNMDETGTANRHAGFVAVAIQKKRSETGHIFPFAFIRSSGCNRIEFGRTLLYNNNQRIIADFIV